MGFEASGRQKWKTIENYVSKEIEMKVKMRVLVLLLDGIDGMDILGNLEPGLIFSITGSLSLWAENSGCNYCIFGTGISKAGWARCQ